MSNKCYYYYYNYYYYYYENASTIVKRNFTWWLVQLFSYLDRAISQD